MDLNFKELPEQTNDRPEYLSYGIHDVTISGIVSNEPEGKSPYVEFSVFNDNGQFSERFFVTQAAFKYTMKKLQDLAVAAGIPKDKIEACKKVEQFDKLVAGKQVRIKIVAEEFEGTNKRMFRYRTAFGKWVVPAGAGGLHFTENAKGQKGDIKWLPEKDNKEDDAPF